MDLFFQLFVSLNQLFLDNNQSTIVIRVLQSRRSLYHKTVETNVWLPVYHLTHREHKRRDSLHGRTVYQANVYC